MSSAISALSSVTPASSGSAATTSTTAANDPLANESTFLKLLVSQLKNQDPLSPTDSNQFVSQLTAYSQLEQLIGIHKDTTSLSGSAAPASPTAAAPDDPTSTGTTSTGTTPITSKIPTTTSTKSENS